MYFGRAKPFLRWAGSKQLILPKLLSHISKCKYSRYIEPFAGSAALFFYLSPSKSIICDINSSLIEVYEVVRDSLAEMYECLDAYENKADVYYGVRSMDADFMSKVERAARFIYLNRFCFNGLYRTNKDGVFNVPYGGYKTGALPSYELLKNCSLSLQGVQLMSCDFESLLPHLAAGDIVYLDPPYFSASKRVFTEYNDSCFYSEDLKRLRCFLDHMNSIGVGFLLTYLKSDESSYLSKDFLIEEISVRRNVAADPTKRCFVKEVIITNIE